MTSDLPLVLEAVEALGAELARLTQQATSLGGVLSARERAATVTKLRRAQASVNRALAAVRDSVLESADELSIERFESAFRARSIVLQLQLQRLKQIEPQVAHRLWPASGRFKSVDDVSAFVLDRIGRLNAAWSEERRGVRQNHSPDSPTLIAAVARAEHALIAIGKDSDVASFLAVGASLTCEEFRTPCRVIAALLAVALAPLAPITRRSLHASSLARRLARHAATFSIPADNEEDLDG